MNETQIRDQIERLLSVDIRMGTGREGESCAEVFNGALTLAISIYGVDSPQVTSLQKAWTEAVSPHQKNPVIYQVAQVGTFARGCLQNLKAEIDAGILGNLRRQLAADVISDFIKLARNVLDDASEPAKNVAAVLSAAAFEDAMRRLRESLGKGGEREDLQDVITALKEGGLLQAPQIGVAQSYLSFRNHALHANWEKIDRTSVHSVLAFVEQLLLKHFQS